MNAEEVTKAINKHFGSRMIAKVSDVPEHLRIRTVPFGILGLDLATGGAPLGRAIQIAGYEGTCKTGLALTVAGNAQRKIGKPVYFIDTEHSFEDGYCRSCGLDPDNVYISEPESLEVAGEVAEVAVSSNAYSCVILDSFGAREAQNQIDKSLSRDAYQSQLRAVVINQISRKLLRGVGAKGNFDAEPVDTIFISTNHQYEVPHQFAGPKVPGGHGQRHAGSILIRMTRSKTVKIGSGSDKKEVGREITWLVEKCKIAPDGRSGRVEFYTANHNGLIAPTFNTPGEIINYGVGLKLIKRRGNQYSYMAASEDCNDLVSGDTEGAEMVIGGSRAEAEAYLAQIDGLVDDMYYSLMCSVGWKERLE